MPMRGTSLDSPPLARVLAACAVLALLCGPTDGQSKGERVDLETISRIREEALQHSQIPEIAEYLTDVTGPRLTGSPNILKAEEYAVDRLKSWGISNAHREAWGPFGRGWTLEGITVNMTQPDFSPLIAYPKAWSPGTDGTVRGEAIYLDAGAPADVEKYRGKLKGKIVLLGPPRALEPNFEPQAQRTSDDELLKLANAQPPPNPPQPFRMNAEQRARAELSFAKWSAVFDEDAAVVIEPGLKDAGTVYVTSAMIPYPVDTPEAKRARPWDSSRPKVIPQVVVAAEQYNRMIRLLSRGIAVRLEVNVAMRFHDEDTMAYNVIGEIPGTDLAGETAMIGASIDSWHAGTGATDNAAGTAVALEVMRIFRKLELTPRRTVRVGIWSGEEQGRLGSRAYVARHLAGRNEEPEATSASASFDFKAEYAGFSGYFNLDYGTGRLRGIYLQGNEAVRTIFRAWLAPLEDLGAGTLTISNIGAADHISFDEIGLPGFQFIRDYMEFRTRSAHTNMDVYDHVLEDDLKQSAAVAASLIYDLAMRDEKLPRKPLPTR
jgi:carboxypeptidase Q